MDSVPTSERNNYKLDFQNNTRGKWYSEFCQRGQINRLHRYQSEVIDVKTGEKNKQTYGSDSPADVKNAFLNEIIDRLEKIDRKKDEEIYRALKLITNRWLDLRNYRVKEWGRPYVLPGRIGWKTD